MVLKAFLVGGTICIFGQVLIDKTKLTPARILVAFVTLGAILGGLRHLSTLNQFCRLRSNRTFNRIWKSSFKRCYSRSKRFWIYWSIHRWRKSISCWHFKCYLLRLYCLPSFQTKNQKAISFLIFLNTYIQLL